MSRIPTECPQHFVSLKKKKKIALQGNFDFTHFRKIHLSGFGFDV